MKLLIFTFKHEAIWIVVFSLAPIVIGVLVAFVIWGARLWRAF